MKRTGTILAITTLAIALVACGDDSDDVLANAGSGGNGSGSDSGSGSVAGPVVARGTVSGFGSVIVNSIHYDVTGATFRVDDGIGSESALDAGDVVTVTGTLSGDGKTGTASTITYEAAIEGPIWNINPTKNAFTVLGQVVHISAGTSFDPAISPASLDGLATGDRVEVSGYALANGGINATRIEPLAVNEAFEVNGKISKLDTGAMTFHIGNLQVDYSSSQLPDGLPAQGQRVEVEGSTNARTGLTTLFASTIEVEDKDLPGQVNDYVELTGFITRFGSSTDFNVGGISVTTDSGTEFDDGTSADLGLNVKVEVDGTLNSKGTVMADEIDVQPIGHIEIESTVQNVDPAQNKIWVLGIPVNVDRSTRFEDHQSSATRDFSLADIALGDYVEIHAYRDSDGIHANRLERDTLDSEVKLQGLVESVTNPGTVQFVILNNTITTDGTTKFYDKNDQAIDATAFSTQAEGRIVEVEGIITGSGGSVTILAEEASLEGD